MIPRQLYRSVLVAVAAFGLGMSILFAVAPERKSGPLRGIRIGRVDEADARAAHERDPILPGLPGIRELSGPRYHRFESVELPAPGGGTETVRYLAYHLACERVLPDERRAEKVVFSLYPRPGTLEEARRLASSQASPVVVITAGVAVADRVFGPSGSGDADWVLTLAEGVRIHSLADERRADLEADHLVCHAAERRVESNGPVSIVASEYTIRGVGLSGSADLGTFSIDEDVEIVLPTGALLGPGAREEAPTTTEIRCGGPLFVQRLGSSREADGRTPTRVNLENGVHAVSGAGSDAGETTLVARRLDLLLAVLTARDPEPGEETVRVESLVAEGDVEFARADVMRATASRLRIERREAGARILFTGPADFRYRGVLPLPGAPEGAEGERGDLHVTAGREIEIVREESLRGFFDGGVTAKRRNADGDVLLVLESRELSLASDAALGEELAASGDARFRTPAMKGSAGTITWRSEHGGAVTIRLDGEPAVDVRGGSGTNPLEVPEEGEAGPRPVLHLESEGPLVLRESGETKRFTVTGPALVTRTLSGREQLRVRANSVEAELAKEVLTSLVAEGKVSARGSAEELGGGTLSADADRFTFSEEDGLAVLTGSPAAIHIAETETESNEITAPRLTFRPTTGRVTASEGVIARVFLEEDDGEDVRPIRLSCETLELEPKPEVPGAAPPDDPTGRIERLVATGAVVLDAMEWRGRGERLVVTTENGQEIALAGAPAVVTRVQRIAGRDFEDRFTADAFTLALRDEKIVSFVSPDGGDFLLYRAFRDDGVEIFGERGADEGPRTLERFTGRCEGKMFFDQPGGQARLTGGARVEQAAGVPGELETIAAFTADVLEAHFDKDEEDGALLLRRAEGRGAVEGEGEGWKAFADGFSVDFRNKQTIVWGKPARVVVGGEEQTVVRAVYDYGLDEWSEFFRAEGR